MSEEIRVRPENLPPLAKDLVAVVTAYKKIKGLGPSWEAKHMARGLIYAGELLTAVGVQGGQVDRAVALLEWLKESGKDFDLGTAPSFYGAYQAHLTAKANSEYSRCSVCNDKFKGSGKFCPRHPEDEFGEFAN